MTKNIFFERKLGASERLVLMTEDIAPSNFLVAAKILGKINVEKLQGAIKVVKLSHPLLNARVDIDSLTFVCCVKPDFYMKILKTKDENLWLSIVEKEINTPFNFASDILFRVILIIGENQSELIICFNHLIADGVSATYLLQEILETYSNLNERSMKRFLPPLEELLINESEPDLYNLFDEKLPEIAFNNSLVNDTVNLVAKLPSLTLKTKVIHSSFSAEMTKAFTSKCKQNGISVHSAISTIALLSLSELIKNKNYEKDIITLSSMVNLRPYLQGNLHAYDLGYYVSRIDIPYRIEKNSTILQNMVKYGGKLKESLSQKLHYSAVTSTKGFLDEHDSGAQMKGISEQKSPLIIISNAGKFNFNRCDEFKLINIQRFSACHAVLACPYSFSLNITTYNDIMILNTQYTHPFVKKDDAEFFSEYMYNSAEYFLDF